MKVTPEKVRDWIREGRGVGTGDQYKPWIQITRNLASPNSNQCISPMPTLRRLCHFLSRSEFRVAHLLWWLDAHDVREQFPLWPWPHQPPSSELSAEENLPLHPGLQTIAADAGIPLYPYPGLKIPAIPSLDFVVTLPGEGTSHRLVGCSVKPADVFLRADSVDRVRERLELDRRYCASSGMGHVLVHGEELPSDLIVNLEWLAPLRTRAEIEALITSQRYVDFVGYFSDDAYEIPASRAARRAAARVDCATADAVFAMHTAIWRQDVDADLLTPLCLHRPLTLGGRALKTVLRQRVFGEIACN